MHEPIVAALLASPEPAIRWKLRARVLGERAGTRSMTALREEIRGSALVRRLLDPFESGGPPSIYAKWQGAHWVLAALADLGYPPGDKALHPLRERVLAAWLDPTYQRDVEIATKSAAYRRGGVPLMRGRHRAHASQQGNALRALTMLGLADDRCEDLAALVLRWQWPDGGWNCDRDPAADSSSFMETLTPMRGLWAHGTAPAKRAARRAAEVMALGLLGDPRCGDALDLLESMRLPDGGWPAQARYFRPSTTLALHHNWVDWGGTSARRANPWVTTDALAVLRAAGRLDPLT